MRMRYSMLLQWSDEDGVYVVTLPEFAGCKTHGATYEEAARHGQEALASRIEAYQADGDPLPCENTFDAGQYIVSVNVQKASGAAT